VVEPGHAHRQKHHSGAARGDLDGVLGRHGWEGQLLDDRQTVGRAQCELLVREVRQRDLVVRRDRVLLADHHHRALVVERDQVEAVALDRQPHQGGVDRAVTQAPSLVILLDQGQVELLRPSFAPGPRPLVRGRSRHERDAEGLHVGRLVALGK